jgi:hypothetical protein
VLLGEYACGRYTGDGAPKLVLPADNDVAFALQHRFKPGLRDTVGSSFLLVPDFVSFMPGRIEKLSLRRSRHQAGHSDV